MRLRREGFVAAASAVLGQGTSAPSRVALRQGTSAPSEVVAWPEVVNPSG